MIVTELSEKLAWHWYDFVCPYCYLGLSRSSYLAKRGYQVVNLPLQVYPDIPPHGMLAEYELVPDFGTLSQGLFEAGLEVNWPSKIPNSRRALALAEWTRRNAPQCFASLYRDLFAAHFVRGEDLADPHLVDYYASESGVDITALHRSIADGTAFGELEQSESAARRHGVRTAPAWVVGKNLISGLQTLDVFEALADAYLPGTGQPDHQMLCLLNPVQI